MCGILKNRQYWQIFNVSFVWRIKNYISEKQKKKFAIECKWRSSLSHRYPKPLFQAEQILFDQYHSF